MGGVRLLGVLLCLLFCAYTKTCTASGSAPKTTGQPWPLPKNIQQTPDVQALIPTHFQFTITGSDCDILRSALTRYFKIIFYPNDSQTRRQVPQTVSTLQNLAVNVQTPCESTPLSLEMDESYQLQINKSSAQLISKSIWGTLRGLETFSQIIYQDQFGTHILNNTLIDDAPRYQHRGVMLDTSRHFLAKEIILSSLEAMTFNKINVFHWHLVDDQSFPYQSPHYPDLSQKGAYDPYTHIYTQNDIAEIVEFARLRGIRVLPEFDTPGHTQSWEPGQPGLLTKCCTGGKINGNYGPIDPTLNSTYDFLAGLMKEVTTVFPDHFVHLGGDEVSKACWQSNPNITAFMKKMSFGTDYNKLENYYEQRLLDIVNSYNHGYIVWQEIFDNKINVRSDTVIHVWKGNWQKEMFAVTNSSLKALLSMPWYLDYISYGKDWQNYYKVDPGSFNGTAAQQALVMGGEAALWAEYVDGTNVQSRLWPRASAIAERLWSPMATTDNSGKAAPRMEEHRCRMVKRGIPAEPENGPSFCQYEFTNGHHF